MKSTNIIYHHATVTRQRRNQLNKHKSVVLWFTGLSGSGKSTMSHALEERLFNKGCRTFVLDGDNVRHGLNKNLGFSAEDRAENIRRVGEVGKLFVESGAVTLTAFISPYREDRDAARALLGEGQFVEVFVKASLETCEARDPKGLYAKARAGEIKGFTGIDDPYEEPADPELVLDADDKGVEELAAEVIAFLDKAGCLGL